MYKFKALRVRAAYWGVVAIMSTGLLSVMPALAQESDDVVEEVLVTGSRIIRNDLQSFSPVTVLDASEITFTGNNRIEDLVTSLPQAIAAQNSTVANGASGTATVNLRQLGSVRTLVLINGRRMAPGDVFSVAPDLNFIPSAMVERVDILTGGASSVYGTDAVAGVVNFIIDKDFEGVKVGLQHSLYQHDNDNALAQSINEARGFDVPSGSVTDGETTTASIAIGGAFAEGRGHASAYLTYRDIESIVKASRDYTNCTVNTGSNGPRCGGSSTTPRGRFIVPRRTLPDGTVLTGGDYVLDWEAGGTTFRPRMGDVFNFGPFNHIQRPDRQWTAGGFLDYELSDRTEAYLEVMFMDDNTDAQIAPSGNFGRTTTINCDNPMLSPQQFDLICTQQGYARDEIADVTILRRNIEGGPRTNQIRHTAYRVMSGLRGDLNDHWSYDVYGLYAENTSDESYINDLHIDRIADALNVISDPVTGEPVCRSGNSGCVPWNVFEQGAVTQEAVDYISTTAVMTGSTKTQVFDASLTGDLGFNLPTAQDGVQVAAGVTYRKEELLARPDEIYALGLRAGSGGATPPIDGGFDVREVFGEALVPLVQEAKWAEDLSMEVAYRYSDYNLSGGSDTYKTLLSWTPVNDIRFRAGYNRAVRAPNALELFRPQGFGLGGSTDICANSPSTGVPTASLEQCRRTGVSDSQYGTILPNPANQYNTLGGGNPDLEPEIADTYTFGMVLTPRWLPNLTATIDYYDIEVEDAIGSLGANDIVQTCANTGDPALCSLIHRDALGTLWLTQDAFIETTNQNIGRRNAEGVDVNASYSLDIGQFGSLNFNIIGTYLLAARFSNPLTDYDCVGYYGPQCGQPDTEWRHRARLSWETNFDATISLAWRFTGEAEVDDASPDPDLGNPGELETWRINGVGRLSSESYFDLAGTYRINENFVARLGVNNILDTEPPLLPSLSSTGYTSTYDPLGRFVFFGLTISY